MSRLALVSEMVPLGVGVLGTPPFAYYHRTRTHLSLDKDAPDVRSVELETARIVEVPEVGGLHHRCVRGAA